MSTSHPIVIGLTGGIGSGKSTVASLFGDWGAAVVDADTLARDVVAKGSIGLQRITEEFGTSILLTDGTLDRKALGQIVFADAVLRERLESIVHPLVRERWLSLLAELKASGRYPIIVYAVPLLFESGLTYPELDYVVGVGCPDSIRIARVMARDGSSEEHVRQRINAQIPESEKLRRCNFVITNDAGLTELTARSRQLWEKLLTLRR